MRLRYYLWRAKQAALARPIMFSNLALKALEDGKVYACCGTCVYGRGCGLRFERICVKTAETNSQNPIWHWCGDHLYGDYEDFMNRPANGPKPEANAPPDGS